MVEQINYVVSPTTALLGQAQVPGDKSISHRALMLGAIADGITTIHGLLMGADNLATLQAMRALGVNIDVKDTMVRIIGVGMHGLTAPNHTLDLGNSGTGIRLLTGLLAGQNFASTLIGDESLNRRPMGRIVNPLKQMGASINIAPESTPPIHISGGMKLQGITYAMPMASAQVKSCLLLAGLYAQGKTTVIEPAPSRDHTERMLRTFSYPVQSQGSQVSLIGGLRLRGCEIQVPGDISSAAFFMVAATIIPGSNIVLKNVGINPTRIGIINILKAMNADIELENLTHHGSEPVADIRVRAAALRGITIPAEQVPLAIDEFPVLFIAAACAKGKTTLQGAAELRIKESDRLATMATGLQQLGITTELLPDGIIIEGGTLHGGEIDSAGDHRIAMAFAVAACMASAPVTIHDCKNVVTSFPDFVAIANHFGMKINRY